MNQFHPFEEEDQYEYPKAEKPGGKFPQKGRQEYRSAETRRSPDGISPMVETRRPVERLYSYTELNALVDRLSSLGEVGRIGARAIMERQTELLSQLSPDEQAAWAESALR